MCVCFGETLSADGYVRVPIKPEAFRCLRLAKNRIMLERKDTRVTYSDVIMYLYKRAFENGG